MNYAAAWFLVSIATGQYIGPLNEAACKAAAVQLVDPAIVCRQASAAMACDVPNRPGTYTACPVFDFPAAKVKP
jgi:hypothetical protein